MESFINFKNDENNNNSLKLNMDELFIKKQQQDLNVLNNYNKILTRIHNKIKYCSKQLVNDQCCWYVVPEFIIGIPKYNHLDCISFVIDNLRKNGFIVRYTHPNLLFISWKQWIPSYVRNEIKKKTGKNIDEYGNIKNTNDDDNKDDDFLYINNLEKNNNDFDNKLKINYNKNNKNNNNNNNNKNEFKSINTYKPSGLIYSENLLKNLNI